MYIKKIIIKKNKKKYKKSTNKYIYIYTYPPIKILPILPLIVGEPHKIRLCERCSINLNTTFLTTF